jgi:hypothetical protein
VGAGNSGCAIEKKIGKQENGDRGGQLFVIDLEGSSSVVDTQTDRAGVFVKFSGKLVDESLE